MIVRKVVNDCLTGPDNETYDFAKVSCALAMSSLMLQIIYMDIVHSPYSLTSISAAYSAIVLAFAGMIRINKDDDNPRVQNGQNLSRADIRINTD